MAKNAPTRTDAPNTGEGPASATNQATAPPADTAVNSGPGDTPVPAGGTALLMEVVIDRFRVRATPKEGFRRAGRHWPAEGVEVDADELTEEQITALLTEPMLVVTPIASRVPGAE